MPRNVLILILGLSLMGFGMAHASSSNDYLQLTKASYVGGFVGESCGDHVCAINENPHFWLQYIQSKLHTSEARSFQTSNTPELVELIAPDGTCNINGTLNVGGSCSVPNPIISATDYASLQSDPAILAVPIIQQTNAQPTTTFCNIANWIVNAEDGYSSQVVNVTNLIDPPYCHAVPVPEFGTLSFIIMGLAVLTVVSVTALHNKLKLN